MIKIRRGVLYFWLSVYFVTGLSVGLICKNLIEEEKQCDNGVFIQIDDTDFKLAKQYIKDSEGLSLTPYKLNGHYYIGYGYQTNNNHKKITEEQADSLLEEALFEKIYFVSNKYKVSGNEALSLGMLLYSLKPNSLSKSRLSNQLLNKRNEEIIRDSWTSFCIFNGKENKRMKARRQFEVDLFFKH